MEKKYVLFALALTLFIAWSAFSFLEAWRVAGSLLCYQLGRFPFNVGTAVISWLAGTVLIYVVFRKLIQMLDNSY